MRDQGLWTWHIISGLVILILLGLHMGIMHLDYVLGIFNPAGGHPIDWANVVARGKSSLLRRDLRIAPGDRALSRLLWATQHHLRARPIIRAQKRP